jgi:hypothetical protein
VSERLNGGPYYIAPGHNVFMEYWWGEYGDDRHLTCAYAHPLGYWGHPSSVLSFEPRAFKGTGEAYKGPSYRNDDQGGSYWYGFTIHNDSTSGVEIDVYAATP